MSSIFTYVVVSLEKDGNCPDLVVVTRTLPRDGGMAEDHGAPEAVQLLRAWTRGRRETESRRRVSGAKSPQLDSAERDEKCPGTSVHRRCRKNSQFCQFQRDKNLTEGCVCCSADEREHTASVTKEHTASVTKKFLGGN